MAKNDKSDAKGKKDKTKGGKKAKKGKGAGDGVSVAAHPRAAAQVRRAKGFGGLAFFAIAAYLSYKANVPPDQVALRALGFGVAGYMFAWAASVTIARHLVLAELRHAVESGRATYAAKPEGAPAPAPAADAAAGKQDGDSE